MRQVTIESDVTRSVNMSDGLSMNTLFKAWRLRQWL
jgi:hypothetical protein